MPTRNLSREEQEALRAEYHDALAAYHWRRVKHPRPWYASADDDVHLSRALEHQLAARAIREAARRRARYRQR